MLYNMFFNINHAIFPAENRLCPNLSAEGEMQEEIYCRLSNFY